MKKRLLTHLKKVLKKYPFAHATIAMLFSYRAYKKLYHGKHICAAALESTGDYYLTGLLWNSCNKQLIIPSTAARQIVKLFPTLKHVVCVNEKNVWWKLIDLARMTNIHFTYFLKHCNRLGLMDMSVKSPLMGYRGLNILDAYRMAMNEKNEAFALPVFDNDASKVQALLKQIGGKPNKTVLIAPYATTSVLIAPPDDFWTTIVSTLQKRGYTVATNCAGRDVPLKGTCSILIPYAHIVPFLDTAGYFIGVRSGLCDIISTTKAKKIILHPYEAQNWPDGTSLSFTGLNNMGLCDDAIELEATSNWDNYKELENRILCELN